MLRVSPYPPLGLEVDPDAICLAQDAFERRVRTHVQSIFSLDDFRDLHPCTQGAPTCCPLVLSTMLLFQSRFNVSDRDLIARCTRDLGWRYALGLTYDQLPPSASSVRRFRRDIRRHKGDDFLLNRILDYAVKNHMIEDFRLQAMDSTNTDCRGAVIDTFNLVATAIGRVLRLVARALGEAPASLAKRWGLDAYLARSIKGNAAIDWSDEAARNRLLTREIADAALVQQRISESSVVFSPDVTEAMALLQQVVRQDVEQLPDGSWKIARGTVPGRVISITDPEARHGRKSASHVIHGFKTHIIGTIKSQFVTGISVTNAGTHDAKAAPGLLDQVAAREIKPEEVVADAAYSTGEALREGTSRGVAVRTKMPSPSCKTAIPKREFAIDLNARTVTCPAGQIARDPALVADPAGGETPVEKFKFKKEDCQKCPLKERCSKQTAKGGGRTLILSAYEVEIQEMKAFNATERAKPLLRSRCAVERLIAQLVRMGMRHARFFGMYNVQFQAYMTAAAYNLQRIITLNGQEG